MKVIYQEICSSNSTNTPFVPSNPNITKKRTVRLLFLYVLQRLIMIEFYTCLVLEIGFSLFVAYIETNRFLLDWSSLTYKIRSSYGKGEPVCFPLELPPWIRNFVKFKNSRNLDVRKWVGGKMSHQILGLCLKTYQASRENFCTKFSISHWLSNVYEEVVLINK